jgi:hypothetical protein
MRPQKALVKDKGLRAECWDLGLRAPKFCRNDLAQAHACGVKVKYD